MDLEAMAQEMLDLRKEVQHWKANHANLVLRNQVFIARPDLPFERTVVHARVVKLQRRLRQVESANHDALVALSEILSRPIVDIDRQTLENLVSILSPL